MGDQRKRRPGGLNVSTKVENAWYVDPNILAGEDVDALHPPMAEDGLPMDATVNISESDLEEADAALAESDEDARHYRDVSLKGALLSPDGTQPEVETLGDKLKDLGERGLDRLRGDEVARPSPPRSSPPVPGQRTGPAALIDGVSTLLREAARLFEPGFVPPVWIAAIAFVLGMGFTLIGVLIAL